MKTEERKELFSRLERYVEAEVEKEEASYSKAYRESKWYQKATINDAFPETMVRDILNLKDALNNSEDLASLESRFEGRAREFGRSWWDEDLHCYRTGYEWETGVYVYLHNLVSEVTGNKLLTPDECYEGYGK